MRVTTQRTKEFAPITVTIVIESHQELEDFKKQIGATSGYSTAALYAQLCDFTTRE